MHDVICKKSGRLIGTVRSCWAHKYGSRYGGVGIEATGALEVIGRAPNGDVVLRIDDPSMGPNVEIRDRIAKITD